MKKLILMIAAALSVASFTSAQTQSVADDSGVYIRPEAVLAFPGHFDTAGGGAIAIGDTFARMHSIEAQAIVFHSRDNGEKVTFIPMLVNYDFHFLSSSPLSFKVGASIGATYEKGEYWWWSENATAFTAGLRAGVEYKVAKNVSLNATVTTLTLTGTDVVTSGSMALVSGGVTYRF